MRRLWVGLGFLLATLLVLSGCTTKEKVRPPKQPESFLSPPEEARYREPLKIPANYLNQDGPRKDNDPSAPDSPLRKTPGSGGRGF